MFMWTPGMGAAYSYTIQISTDCGFSTIYRTATIYPTAAIPTPNQYLPTADLTPDTTFCWRIRANSILGNSDWRVSAPFHTANPPTTPVLTSPVNGSIVNDSTPDLKWNTSSIYGTAVFGTYQIQIFNTGDVNNPAVIPVLDIDQGTAATPPDPELDIVTTKLYTVNRLDVVPPPANPDLALSPGTLYYARIRALNTAGEYSTWSPLIRFTVGVVGKVKSETMNPSETFGNVPGMTDPSVYQDPPTAPWLARPVPALPYSLKSLPPAYAQGDGSVPAPVSPYLGVSADNVRLLSLRPKFSWDPGGINAQAFNLQIANPMTSSSCNISDPNKSTFVAPFINVNVPDTPDLLYSYIPPLDLPANQVLCWRVRPYHNTYKYGEWSDVQIFLTSNPPPIPKPLYPSSRLNTDTTPKFQWTAVTPTRVGDTSAVFGKYEIEISFRPDFKGYTYPANKFPPYDEATLSYPVVYPALPGTPINVVALNIAPVPSTPEFPVLANAPLPFADCAKYPAVSQAYDTDPGSLTYGEANDYNEPWLNLHEDVLPVLGDPGMLLPNGSLCGAHTYYWRVRAYNSYGEYSEWSTTGVLPITVDPPTNLGMGVVDTAHLTTSLAPANVVVDARAQELRPIFTWNPVYHAEVYDVYITNSPNPFLVGTYYKRARVWTNSFQPNYDLPSGIDLYMHVFSIDSHGLYGSSLISDRVTFRLPTPPPAPSLVTAYVATYTPRMNELVNTYTPTFTWPPVIPPVAVTFDHYEIEISRDSTFSLGLADDVSGSSLAGSEFNSNFTVPALTPLTPMQKYYWRVRSCDGTLPTSVCSTWSSVSYFRTIIPSPINLTANPPGVQNPVFGWDPVPGASYYRVMYTRDPATSCAASAFPYGSNTFTNSYTLPYNFLLPSSTYQWCVWAMNPTYGPSLVSTSTYVVP
jgi:hypothetical protein